MAYKRKLPKVPLSWREVKEANSRLSKELRKTIPCPGCGKSFYPNRFKHMQFCTPDCREKNWKRVSIETRAKRNEKNREGKRVARVLRQLENEELGVAGD